MQALVFTADNQLEITEVPNPEVREDDVLVAVKAVGICGSDVEGYLGKTGRRVPPLIMGHELAGKVKTAPKSSGLEPGDTVTVHPKLFCDQCSFCTSGRTNICPHGKFLGVMHENGGLAEFVAVPARYVYRVNPAVPSEHACLAEPLAVVTHAAALLPPTVLQQAQQILIVGGGPIGLLLLQVLRSMVATPITVSDLLPTRRQLALSLGAKSVFDPASDSITPAFDVAFEAVGAAASAAQSLDALQLGGNTVWIGNAQKHIEINMQAIVTRELTVHGSFLFTETDFQAALKLLESGSLQLSPLITVKHGLEHGPDLFKALAAPRQQAITKAVLTL